MTFELDTNFRDGVTFRRLELELEKDFQSMQDAVYAAFIIYVNTIIEVSYASQTGRMDGGIDRSGLKLLQAKLREMGLDGGRSIEVAIGSGLLEKVIDKGPDCEEYICREYNRGGKNNRLKREKKGGLVSGLRRTERKAREDAQITALDLMPDQSYVDVAGDPLSQVDVTDAITLIRVIDRTLGRKPRKRDTVDFPEPLVTKAHQCLKIWADTYVYNDRGKKWSVKEAICSYVNLNKGTDGFPSLTEKILDKYDDYARFLVAQSAKR